MDSATVAFIVGVTILVVNELEVVFKLAVEEEASEDDGGQL